MNENITAKVVKLIDDKKTIGDVSIKEALKYARNANLDLVLVSQGDIPVCRILDFDHYRFERKKAEKETLKRQRELTVETKEIRLRPVTTDNDITIKVKKAREFLDEGNKVKVIIKLKGRERSHKEHAYSVINKFLEFLGEHKIEKPPFDGDGDILMLLAPMISKSEAQKNEQTTIG